MLRFFRLLIVGLVIAFAALAWFRPDFLLNVVGPAADNTIEWLEDRARAMGLGGGEEDPAPTPTPDPTVDPVPTPQPGDLLPAPTIPDTMDTDAPLSAESLREAGFVVAHSDLPDFPEVVDFTPATPPAGFTTNTALGIVGGQADDIREAPWLVGLIIHSDFVYEGEILKAIELCGGGVFNERFIVTAAHCIEGDYREIEVVAATSDLNDENAVRRTSQRAFIHAGYERAVLREDIGVIELSEPLPGYIPSAPWPDDDQVTQIPLIERVIGRGFGITEEGFASERLKRVELEVIESNLRVLRVADGEGEIEGLCQGDSGTPVEAVNPDGENFIVGMVSYTEAIPGAPNCSTPSFPAGLVSLEGYMDNIRSLVALCTADPGACDA